MNSSLPSEFAELYGKVMFVRRKSPHEFCSSCPACGGSVHADGEYPDRFVMLMPSRSKAGIPFGWCRKCGYRWWPSKDTNNAVDPETLRLLQEQVREAEEARAEERRRKLAEFSTRELWEELHKRMGDEQREWWRAAGVPDDWQDYLHLGYDPDKIYTSRTGTYHCPAYTIPYFGYKWQFRTMQYRLVNPEDKNDRYRFEAGLGTTYYMSTPSLPIGDEVIICEGAKKAMVVRIYSGEQESATVIAIPSKSDWKSNGTLEAVKDCGRVYIALDPDCWEAPDDALNWIPQPIQLARAIGKKQARIMEMPVKADDAFTMYNLTEVEWKSIKKQAMSI